MRRKTGSYLLTAVAVALAAGVAAPSSAAPAAKPAVLAGTVTISGSQDGFVPVRVPKDMSLGNPFLTKYRNGVTVTGGGDAAGFVLVEDGLEGVVLIGGKSTAFAPAVERSGIPVSSLNRGERDDGLTYAVPAGSYKLYLVTGGKPTTVTLRFIGGTGSSRVAPTTRTQPVVQSGPLDALVPGPVGGVYGGGGAVSLTTPVVQFSLNRFDTSVHTETVLRYCFYAGSQPTGPQPYGPACAAPAENDAVAFDPGGETFIVSDEGVDQASFYGFSGSLTTTGGTEEVVDAELAAGLSLTSGGAVTSSDYTQFWLSLAPAAAAAAPAAPPAQQQPPQQPPAAPPAPEAPAAPAAAAQTLPATGLPSPVLAVGTALLAAAGLTRRNRSHR